ncbi:MAG: shufflon system plasmid conjugative transfer pilus tip adhesin PilV, partial [Youngiibacter sp.]|nr:shufflon system plasmid conjugative transfer pilus tip adhesin PilV [Youngiibacter sp.]
FTNTYSIYVGVTHIATKSEQGDSCTFSGAELDGIYATIPNAVSTTATLYVTTYSGGTQIGSTQSVGATASVGADINPTFLAVVAEETDTEVANLGLGAGNYVQNLSRIRFTITGASGAKSSWITSYKITFNGVNYTSNPSTTGSINATGTLTATATVTDSRGRTSTSKTVNCNLIAYSTPTISAFSAFRSDSSGNAAPLGTYAKFSAVGSIASISSKNQITYKIESKLRSSSIWTTHINSSLSAGTTSLNVGPIYSNFAATSSYDLKLTLSDKFNTITSQISLPTGEVALSWGKTGVGIGKVWEQGGLDVAGTFYLNGEPITAVNKALDSGTDLNTVTTSGWYRLSGSHSNAPSNYAYGQMLVIHGAFDTIAQLLFPYNDDTVWRRSGNPTNVGGSGAWRTWTQVGGGSYLPLSGGTLSGNLTVPSVYTSNWFRSTGASGWYSETYGGGWYMTDSSWIRAYNNKGIHTGGILSADGGLNIGAGTDVNLYASGSSPSDPGDLVFRNSSGSELSRLYHLSDGLYYRLNGSGGGKVFTNEFLRNGTVYLTNSSWTSVSYSYLGGTIRVLGMGITNVSGESYMKVRNISSTGFEAVVGGTGTANTFNWVAIGT